MDRVGRTLLIRWAGPAAVALACSLAGCGGDRCGDGGCIDAGKTLETAQAGSDGAVFVVGETEACSAQSVHAMRGPPRPVDVIFVVDNSGSMGEEIAAVRDNINRDFASIIEASGVDYRVLVLSRYGPDALSVCIEPPLAGGACAGGLGETNSARFYHYDQEIGSNDALCQILSTFDRPDPEGRAPEGWQAWLRPDAHKAFVVITDDSPACTFTHGESRLVLGGAGVDPYDDALRFHQALLARSGTHFGVPPEVKYQFFSIVGLAASGAAGEPIFPHQSIVSETCDTAPGAGPTYQALSIITDALRYPVCEGRSFDAVFHVLARSVIRASEADCDFEIPEAPTDRAFLLSSVNLQYQPGDGSEARRFTQVPSLAGCGTQSAFYIADRIRLCPSACNLVKRDAEPTLRILLGCTGIPQ